MIRNEFSNEANGEGDGVVSDEAHAAEAGLEVDGGGPGQRRKVEGLKVEGRRKAARRHSHFLRGRGCRGRGESVAMARGRFRLAHLTPLTMSRQHRLRGECGNKKVTFLLSMKRAASISDGRQSHRRPHFSGLLPLRNRPRCAP